MVIERNQFYHGNHYTNTTYTFFFIIEHILFCSFPSKYRKIKNEINEILFEPQKRTNIKKIWAKNLRYSERTNQTNKRERNRGNIELIVSALECYYTWHEHREMDTFEFDSVNINNTNMIPNIRAKSERRDAAQVNSIDSLGSANNQL